jgi:hypothetical protein
MSEEGMIREGAWVTGAGGAGATAGSSGGLRGVLASVRGSVGRWSVRRRARAVFGSSVRFLHQEGLGAYGGISVMANRTPSLSQQAKLQYCNPISAYDNQTNHLGRISCPTHHRRMYNKMANGSDIKATSLAT